MRVTKGTRDTADTHQTTDIQVRASDGATIDDVERAIRSVTPGHRSVELSTACPLGDESHRLLLKAGVRVRVESSKQWACRMSTSTAEVLIVGPEISRVSALRRLRLARGENQGIDTAA